MPLSRGSVLPRQNESTGWRKLSGYLCTHTSIADHPHPHKEWSSPTRRAAHKDQGTGVGMRCSCACFFFGGEGGGGNSAWVRRARAGQLVRMGQRPGWVASARDTFCGSNVGVRYVWKEVLRRLRGVQSRSAVGYALSHRLRPFMEDIACADS